MHKIAIDPGFGTFRAATVRDGQVRVEVVPSVVGVGDTDVGLLTADLRRRKRSPRPHLVGFDGLTYLVGHDVHRYARPAERLDFLRLSEGPELRALLYASLGLLVQEGSISLLVGLPVEVLQDRTRATETLRALRAWLVGEHVFSLDGNEIHLSIGAVKAIAQPVGAYFAWGLDPAGRWRRERADLKAPIAVCDVGFNTLDLFAIENRDVTAKYTGGDTLGMRRAASLLREGVKRQYDVTLTLHQADALLRERPPLVYTPEGEMDVADLRDQALEATATDVIAFVEERWGNARQFRHLLATGGGSAALRDALLALYPHAIVLDDPVTANARGLAKYAARPGVL